MANDTSYQVYIRQKGKWILDSHYGANDKQTAIDDAKDRERQPGVEAVRVMREIHNAAAGTNRDTTIYITAGLDRTKKSMGASGGGGDDEDDGLPKLRSGAPSRGRSDDDDGPVRGPDRREEEDLSDGDQAEGGIGAKMRAALRLKAAAAGGAAPGRGIRAPMVILKIFIILGVSLGFASATTFAYVKFL